MQEIRKWEFGKEENNHSSSENYSIFSCSLIPHLGTGVSTSSFVMKWLGDEVVVCVCEKKIFLN